MQSIIRAFAAETTAVFAESKFKVATLQEFFYTGVLQSWVNNVFSKLKNILKETQQLRQQRTTCSITSCSTYRLTNLSVLEGFK